MNWMRKSGSSSRQGDKPHALRLACNRILDLPDLLDEETGWYKTWYFWARLEDQLARARKSGHELTLVWASLPLGTWGDGSHLRNYTIIRLGLIEREPRPVEMLFGRLSEEEFVVAVYGTHELPASMAAEKALRQLAALAIESGIAGFPSDGQDAETLLASLRQGVSTPSNVVDFEAYRRRRGPRAA